MERHHIALVGGQLLPIYVGIKEYDDKNIHFIVTSESKGRISLLRPFLTNKIVSEYLCDPFDFHSVRNACKTIIDKFEDQGEFHFNLTGGTKIMVLAAQSLMLEKNIKGFYINQTDSLLTLPSFDQTSLNCSITINEFFKLSDHSISSFKRINDFKNEDIKTAEQIENFATNQRQLYYKLTGFIFKTYKNSSAIPPNGNQKINNDLTLKWSGNKIEIFKTGTLLLSINSENSKYLFFNAGWWELLVAKAISKWDKPKELLLHCELPFRSDKTNTKNEIDILLNLGRQMIFVECKSGNIKQEDVNKMRIVKDTYGGVISKSILVSRFMPPTSIVEKCKELGIEIFYTMAGRNQVNKLSNLERVLDKLSKRLNVS